MMASIVDTVQGNLRVRSVFRSSDRSIGYLVTSFFFYNHVQTLCVTTTVYIENCDQIPERARYYFAHLILE